MASDDNILAAVSGITSGVRDVLVPYFQTRYSTREKLLAAKELALAEKEAGKITVGPELSSDLNLRVGQRFDPNELKILSETRKKPTLSRQPVNEQVALILGLKGTPPLTSGELSAIGNFRRFEGTQKFKTEKEERKIIQEMERDRSRLKNTTDKLDDLEEKIDDLLGRDLDLATGLLRTSFIPGSEGASIAADIESVKASQASAALQEMRENSKTGGALGQTSDRDINLLENAVANISTEKQSAKNLRKNLIRVKRIIRRSREDHRDAFNRRYAGEFKSESTANIDFEPEE